MNMEIKLSQQHISLPNVSIYTDGSCIGNGTDKSYGGYCAIIKYKNNRFTKTIKGGEINTTNSRMELRAIIEGLKNINKKRKYYVVIKSDSEFIVNAINIWLDNWVDNNWKKSDKKDVANKDLWKSFIEAKRDNVIKAIHIKAHSGFYWNEECDKIAKEEANSLKKGLPND